MFWYWATKRRWRLKSREDQFLCANRARHSVLKRWLQSFKVFILLPTIPHHTHTHNYLHSSVIWSLIRMSSEKLSCLIDFTAVQSVLTSAFSPDEYYSWAVARFACDEGRCWRQLMPLSVAINIARIRRGQWLECDRIWSVVLRSIVCQEKNAMRRWISYCSNVSKPIVKLMLY